jgi:O-antigen/teichoic acid export membrane protein
MHDYKAECDDYISPMAKGAGILFVGNVFNLALRYLFQVIVARQLDTGLYGIFTMGVAVFVIAETIASLGLDRGIVRYVSIYRGRGDLSRVKGVVLLAIALSGAGGILATLLLIPLSRVLAVNVLENQALGRVLVLFSIAIPFSVLTRAFIALTQGLQIMKLQVYAKDLFELFSRIILVILFFYLGWTLNGAIFAFVFSTIGASFLGFFYFKTVFRTIMQRTVKPILEAKTLLTFCWPFFFANGFNFIEAWISTFFLDYFVDSTAVGIFGAAYRTSLLMLGIFMAFSMMFSPIIADLYSRKEKNNLERLFKVISKWMFTLSLPVAALMFIFSKEILSVFGRDFTGGSTCLRILIVGQLLNAVTGPLGVLIAMSGRSRLILFNAALHLAGQIVLCLFLIPHYGVIGAGLAKTFSILFLRVLLLLQVSVLLKMHPFQMNFLKPVIGGAASWMMLMLIRTFIPQMGNPLVSLMFGVSIYLGIYGLTLFLLGLDEIDKIVFQKIKDKLAIK